MIRARAMVRTYKCDWIDLIDLRKRRTGYWDQHVDRYTFRMLRQVGQRHKHIDATNSIFAHAEDAAAANLDARFPDMRQGFQTVSKAVCGDDLTVIVFGRIDVVVIIVEAYLSQPYSLPAIEHAKSHASLHVQHLDPPPP